MKTLKKGWAVVAFFAVQTTFSQEGIAVYSDYLSDNYYLIHPSMAGAANCGKIRLTGRNQWFGVDDAPALNTLSFNTALDEEGLNGIGAIVFNDRNGYHSQNGAKLTYAHHLRFSRSKSDLDQLSFGLSGAMVRSTLDETQFTGFDPFVYGGIYQKETYFNVDLGVSYHFLDFFAHATIKNLLASRRELYTEGYESDNLRKILLSTGFVFGDRDRILLEPSVMFQYTQETTEKTIDLNLKAYRHLDFGRLWGGLSYRRSFEWTQWLNGTQIKEQRMQWLTPIIGLNFKKYMLSYTYTHILGKVKFDTPGYHQITLGLDIFCKPEPWHCNCPAVN